MDPIIGLLFLYGVWTAGRELVAHTGRSHRAARAAAAAGATARGGSPKTAARQESAAWWFREAGRAFPTARHGWARGWHRHQRAMTQRDRERLEMASQRAEDKAGWRQALLDHSARVAAADDMGYEDDDPHEDREPDMSTQTAEDRPAGRHRKPPGKNCTNPDCTCHGGSGGTSDSKEGPPEMSHSNASSNGAGELTLDELIALTEQGKQHADQAVNEDAIKDAAGIGDKVSGSFPADSTIQGHAHDYEAAVQEITEANQKLADAAAALNSDAESYRTMQEGVGASTGDDVTAGGVLTG